MTEPRRDRRFWPLTALAAGVLGWSGLWLAEVRPLWLVGWATALAAGAVFVSFLTERLCPRWLRAGALPLTLVLLLVSVGRLLSAALTT